MNKYLEEAQERARQIWRTESEQEAFISGVQWIIMQPEIVKLCNLHDVSGSLLEIRQAVADYMWSEGCSCCRNVDAHEINTKRLGELLNVEPYDDNSGYNFPKYRSNDR